MGVLGVLNSGCFAPFEDFSISLLLELVVLVQQRYFFLSEGSLGVINALRDDAELLGHIAFILLHLFHLDSHQSSSIESINLFIANLDSTNALELVG